MKLETSEILQKLYASEDKHFIETFRKENISVELYKPVKIDLQRPHEQDEIYVIISGSGMFQNGGEHYSFKATDLIFVPAHLEHRFYDFTEDFATWVIFV
ncbi:MAG: cupin domain-containing protein [Bacteroidota bacterium]